MPSKLPRETKERRGTVRPSRERTPPAETFPPGKLSKRRSRKELPNHGSDKSPDFAAVALRYVADVLAGRLVAGAWTVKACQRFDRMRRQADSRSNLKQESFTWSPAHVQDVCSFISRLPHVEGRWSSQTIELQPWQVFILAASYGFRKNGAGADTVSQLSAGDHRQSQRLVTSVFFEVGRKSAKSTLVAACALYHLAIEDEPGAQCVCGASTGAQARIVFNIMARMVKRAPWLRELGFVAYANSITLERSGSYAKPINAKSSTQDGLSPSFISLDESHAQTFELHDVLKSAQGSRRSPMLCAPTTAGYSLTSVGYALRSTAMKILDGVLEAEHVFCVLYELDEEDDWRDETTWPKSLPMLGITPSLDYVRKYCLDAQQTPGLQGEFETKCCNRWLHSAKGWLSMAAWARCGPASGDIHQITLEDFAHEPCFIGVDLAERDDIAAVALVFQRDDVIYVFVRGYLPEMVVQDRARAVPQYVEWMQTGELIATEGNMTHYGRIEEDLRRDCESFDVAAIVIERYGALHLASNLTTDGLPATIESKNAKVFTPPAKELEARIRAGKIRHTGSAFLTWQVSNVCVERRRDGSLLPTKESAESPNKVDAVDAILLALSALLSAPTVPEHEPRILFLEA